jgi:hypothetical protein
VSVVRATKNGEPRNEVESPALNFGKSFGAGSAVANPAVNSVERESNRLAHAAVMPAVL